MKKKKKPTTVDWYIIFPWKVDLLEIIFRDKKDII